MLIVILAFKLAWISRVLGNSGVTNITQSELQNIKKNMLKDHDKTIAPILYSNKAHWNAIVMIIKRIQDLDEEKCELVTEQTIFFSWEDHRLLWNSTFLNALRASAEEIWTPTLNVLNRLEPDERILDSAILIFQSRVFWAPRYVLRTYCFPNLRFYPFDQQTCEIQIAGVTQEGEFLALNHTTADVVSKGYITNRSLRKNIRWRYVSGIITQRREKLNLEMEATVEVFTIVIQRTMPMVALCLLTPGIIAVILILSTFWIKPGNSIRVGINLTSMIICSSSLFTLGKCLPATGKVTPIIVEYATTALILTTLSTLQAMIVSVLVRMQNPPDVSQLKLQVVFPSWLLKMLGHIESTTSSSSSTDQTFLFSELEENNVVHETVPESEAKPGTQKPNNSEKEWKYIITLFERLIFYVYVIVVMLFIMSVMINE